MSLKAISLIGTENALVQKCANTLGWLITTKEVNLIWVPGHSGLHSNEKTDDLARQGGTLLFTNYLLDTGSKRLRPQNWRNLISGDWEVMVMLKKSRKPTQMMLDTPWEILKSRNGKQKWNLTVMNLLIVSRYKFYQNKTHLRRSDWWVLSCVAFNWYSLVAPVELFWDVWNRTLHNVIDFTLMNKSFLWISSWFCSTQKWSGDETGANVFETRLDVAKDNVPWRITGGGSCAWCYLTISKYI